ncbi:unnamed protein product [Phytomonas sp. EM1]|nr:unnamed protein product [Phytomonas sp. EM1]|eukprot:CCW64357.1 unnamed protein product [Phytomonas sp. isolate EM1]
MGNERGPARAGTPSEPRPSSPHNSGRQLHSLSYASADFDEDEADAMTWFRRMQKAEEHLKKLRSLAEKAGTPGVEIGTMIGEA